MSMSSDVVSSANSGASYAGTDIIQLHDLVPGQNNVYPITGAYGLYAANESPVPVILIFRYSGSTGSFQVVLHPWESENIISSTELDTVEVWNLCDFTLPTGYAPVSQFRLKAGYILITASNDPVSINKRTGKKKSPVFYSSSGAVTLPTNQLSTIIFGAGGVITNFVKEIQVIDFINFSSRILGLQYQWQDQTIATSLSGLAPSGSNNTIDVPAYGSISMDVESEHAKDYALFTARAVQDPAFGGQTGNVCEIVLRGY